MNIQVGKTYIFAKSGNRVRALEQTGKTGMTTFWLVERADGPDEGKQMVVTADVLASRTEQRGR